MLQAPDLAQAEALYTAFKVTILDEDRMLGHFVNKAYVCRLDDAGETEAADAFYREVLSLDPDSLRDDIEFACLVQEAREESHD